MPKDHPLVNDLGRALSRTLENLRVAGYGYTASFEDKLALRRWENMMTDMVQLNFGQVPVEAAKQLYVVLKRVRFELHARGVSDDKHHLKRWIERIEEELTRAGRGDILDRS